MPRHSLQASHLATQMSAPVFGRDVVCRYCKQVHPTSVRCGANLRDLGMERVEQANDREDPLWAQRAWRWVISLAPGERFFSADVTDAVGMPERYNRVGPLFAELARKGFIRKIGWTNHPRPERHAGPATVWVRR
jgi:hypothetical protein